jgi:hypothetical protein
MRSIGAAGAGGAHVLEARLAVSPIIFGVRMADRSAASTFDVALQARSITI